MKTSSRPLFLAVFVASLALPLVLSSGGCCVGTARAEQEIKRLGGTVDWTYWMPWDPYSAVYLQNSPQEIDDADLAGVIDSIKTIGPSFLVLNGQKGITDASIPLLQQVRSIDTLWLAGTGVTAAGVRSLKGMPKLTEIGVGAPTFTEEDVAALQREMPKVEIVRMKWDGGWLRPTKRAD